MLTSTARVPSETCASPLPLLCQEALVGLAWPALSRSSLTIFFYNSQACQLPWNPGTLSGFPKRNIIFSLQHFFCISYAIIVHVLYFLVNLSYASWYIRKSFTTHVETTVVPVNSNRRYLVFQHNLYPSINYLYSSMIW